MSFEWQATTLGQICVAQGGAIQTGPFGSQLHNSDYKEFGVPVVMPTNIGDGGIVEDGIARIDEADVERLSQHKLRMGDIVFSRRGDVTKNALIRPHEVGWFCGTGCLKVRLGDETVATAKFISHCLRLPDIKDWLVRHAVGATMPNLNTGILAAVPIYLPPLRTQLEIAEILGALDDRITLLRETNATLEAIAQALFKSWFVDFDPVRAKLEGRAPEGMDEATAALFPDGFEESALGLVPRGGGYCRLAMRLKPLVALHQTPKIPPTGSLQFIAGQPPKTFQALPHRFCWTQNASSATKAWQKLALARYPLVHCCCRRARPSGISLWRKCHWLSIKATSPCCQAACYRRCTCCFGAAKTWRTSKAGPMALLSWRSAKRRFDRFQRWFHHLKSCKSLCKLQAFCLND